MKNQIGTFMGFVVALGIAGIAYGAAPGLFETHAVKIGDLSGKVEVHRAAEAMVSMGSKTAPPGSDKRHYLALTLKDAKGKEIKDAKVEAIVTLPGGKKEKKPLVWMVMGAMPGHYGNDFSEVGKGPFSVELSVTAGGKTSKGTAAYKAEGGK
ncbi:MAG: hypothetical protein A2V83_09655 [Nitrospirae bacterium RBG_16_64_22]|nr:MAG: hypothetical protein A2V83_09655 [Nitrospirae bacterium RBG_16_64_22]